MAKRKIYSAEELLNMNKDELIKIYNREAERHNKQVTRAKKRGIEGTVTGKRQTVLKPSTKISKEEIIKRYQESTAANDLTWPGMIRDIAAAMGNKSEAYIKALEKELRKNPKKAAEIINKYRKIYTRSAMGGMKTPALRDIYYEALTRAIETGEIESRSPIDRRGTIFDYEGPDLDVVINLLDRIK